MTTQCARAGCQRDRASGGRFCSRLCWALHSALQSLSVEIAAAENRQAYSGVWAELVSTADLLDVARAGQRGQ